MLPDFSFEYKICIIILMFYLKYKITFDLNMIGYFYTQLKDIVSYFVLALQRSLDQITIKCHRYLYSLDINYKSHIIL